MKLMVTGGAGYIGSVTAQALIKAGHEVVVYDNLSTGYKDLIPAEAKFIFADVRDRELLPRVMRDQKIEGVVHFAAKLIVSESVQQPYDYYDVNVMGALNVVRACEKENIKNLVFSSTAAVYGNVSANHALETDPLAPVNPYGASKRMAEEIIQSVARSSGLKFMILRYFNVAGASLDLSRGLKAKNATHLVKIAAEAAAGKRSEIMIHGTDYETKDGTCVRDYIHVADLADAHVLALNALSEGHNGGIFNCGYGRGASVREVIEIMKKIGGSGFKVTEGPRRAGDPAAVVASADKIRRELKWAPKHDNIEEICKSAFDWEKKL